MLRVLIITRFRRRNVNIVCFLAFKNAYFYTVGAEFSFFTTLSVKEWKFLHGQSKKELYSYTLKALKKGNYHTLVEVYLFLHPAPHINYFNIDQY